LFLTQWTRLQRSQWFDRKKLERLQLKLPKRISQHAYSTVPFYRRLYREASVLPSDLNSLGDLAKLPLVSKENFVAAQLTDRLSSEFSVDECFRRRTSGSTGQPVEILEEPSVYDYMRSYQLRRLSYRYRPWEKFAVLDPRRVERPSKGEALYPFFSRLLIGGGIYSIPMRTGAEQIAALRNLKPSWLGALPSAMRSIANLVESVDNSRLRLRGVLSWGELLDEGTKRSVQTKLGAATFNGYGAVEVANLGGLAWECGRHGFHINTDCVILEFIKDGEPV